MHFIYANLTSGTRHIANVPIACRKGCSHCCNIWVDAMPPEVFYAVKAMAPAQRRAALEAVQRACGITVGRSFDDRGDMVTPCPLLSGDLCSVYAARPINCRTAVSADADICKRSYLDVSGEDIPTPMVWIALRQGYGLALEGAMIHAGLAPEAHEWNEALRLALGDADAEARWLNGANVFAGLPRAGGGSAFDQPIWQAMFKEAFG
ncbi:MAG TPA: YkgJ family cysteine cluster protein [Allosphingosinicella sp.]|nr:YkgJ family cysteine cluster protein [Allosphingosinicella sp.]